MATYNDNTLDTFLETIEKRTRSARLLSVVLTIIPLIIAVLFLLITLNQIQKARTELIAANEDLNRVAEESGRLRHANEEAKAELEITNKEIDSALDKLENILKDPLPGSARTVIEDAISKIRGANTMLNKAKADLDIAKQEPSAEPRRSRQSLISDLFSDQAATRLRAYNSIMADYSADAELIPELLSYASDHIDNANGIYNTLVVLSHLNKAQLEPHIGDIEMFARKVEPMGPRIEDRVDKLFARKIEPMRPRIKDRVDKLLNKLPK